MTDIDTCVRHKELGKGLFGTVYSATCDGKKYALKIEKVLKKDINDKNSNIWCDILFAQKLASKYPQQFMQMYDYKFTNDCEHVQKYTKNIKDFNPKLQKWIKQLGESTYCAIRTFSLVDTTLSQIRPKLNLKQLYSAIIQIDNIVYLMRKHGYAHNDFHSGNIGVVKTDKKTINVMSHKIPTFGYIYQAIDYGMSIHNDNSPKIKKMFQSGTRQDARSVFQLVAEYPFWEKYRGKKLLPFDKYMALFRKTREYEILGSIVADENMRDILFELIFPEQYQRLLLGKEFIKVMPPILKLPLNDILFMASNAQDLPKMIEYFADKLKSIL